MTFSLFPQQGWRPYSIIPLTKAQESDIIFSYVKSCISVFHEKLVCENADTEEVEYFLL